MKNISSTNRLKVYNELLEMREKSSQEVNYFLDSYKLSKYAIAHQSLQESLQGKGNKSDRAQVLRAKKELLADNMRYLNFQMDQVETFINQLTKLFTRNETYDGDEEEYEL